MTHSVSGKPSKTGRFCLSTEPDEQGPKVRVFGEPTFKAVFSRVQLYRPIKEAHLAGCRLHDDLRVQLL
jgi:hypothetical protein